MLTESGCEKLSELALDLVRKVTGKKSGAQAEITLSGSNTATSRFANNEMTQNQAPDVDSIALRLLYQGRQARMESDDLSEEGISRLIENALTACKLLEPDPLLLQLPEKLNRAEKKQLPSFMRFDEATQALTAADRAGRIGEIVKEARSKGASAAGIFASGEAYQAIANSNGLFVYERRTECECSVTVVKDDATGWAKADSHQEARVDCRELARIAVSKAISAKHPGDLKPGRYTVILEPAAVLDLLSYLWWDFSGTSQLDHLSCLEGKLGQVVFGRNINIVDDPFHPLQNGSLVDGEGLPRRKLQLVENGVFKQMALGRRSAAQLNLPATGHSLPEPSAMGEMPLNLVVEGGISSVADMIALTASEAEPTVLLTRVWYVREVDPATKLVTGMTRDGTYLVENGAVARPILNLRFNVGLIEMLNKVIALGPSVRAAGEEGFPAVVPPMMAKDFNFTETTRF